MLSNSLKTLLNEVKKISERISIWNKTRCDSLSACARQARKVVKLIRDDLVNNNYDASTTSYRAWRLSIIPLISKQCKDEIFDALNDGEEKYLSVYKCNCIALLIVEEAISQIDDESVVGDYDFNSNIKLVLNSLYSEFNDSGKYTACIQNFPSKSENLKLEELKYCGKGIEYLKLKAERKNSMKGNFNTSNLYASQS